jgi:hypothetical protein
MVTTFPEEILFLGVVLWMISGLIRVMIGIMTIRKEQADTYALREISNGFFIIGTLVAFLFLYTKI